MVVVQNYAYLICFGFSPQEEEKRARTRAETQRTGENKLKKYFKFNRTLVYLWIILPLILLIFLGVFFCGYFAKGMEKLRRKEEEIKFKEELDRLGLE